MNNTTKPALTKFELDLLEHIQPHAAKLNIGDITDAEHLFDPDYWFSIPPSEHRVLGGYVSRLVARGLLPLVAAEFDSDRHNLYRRI